MQLTEGMADRALAVELEHFDFLVKAGIIHKLEGFMIVSVKDHKRTMLHKPLAELRIGDPKIWAYPYDKIAMGKINMSARTGMSAREVLGMHPGLRRRGDSKYPGSAVLDGIITACSCTEDGHVDEIIAYSLAYTCSSLLQAEVDLQLQVEDEHLFT